MNQIPEDEGGLQYRLPSLSFLNTNNDVISNGVASSPDFKRYIGFLLHKCLLVRKQYFSVWNWKKSVLLTSFSKE